MVGAEDAQGVSVDFAGMLAKASMPERSARSWLAGDDFAINEEIVPLSYEQALKKHARRSSVSQTSERIDRVASLLAETLAEKREQTAAEARKSAANLPAEYGSVSEIEWPILEVQEYQEAKSTPAPVAASLIRPSETKAVSITLRMSREEANQVHKRAADAGLTTSAYIRSCVCEAEVLRAQVKSALQEMRQASAQKVISVPTNSNRPWWNRLAVRG